jgi:hypothetical protein
MYKKLPVSGGYFPSLAVTSWFRKDPEIQDEKAIVL